MFFATKGFLNHKNQVFKPKTKSALILLTSTHYRILGYFGKLDIHICNNDYSAIATSIFFPNKNLLLIEADLRRLLRGLTRNNINFEFCIVYDMLSLI